MKSLAIAFTVASLLVSSIVGARACVSASGSYIFNNCPYSVLVRYDRGYGRMQSSLITSNGKYWTDSPRAGYNTSILEWCNSGGRPAWTCS